jgi:hypothetical protein
MRWQPIDGLQDFWQAERKVRGIPLRAVAFRLADGRLALWSPIKGLGPEAHQELAGLGRPDLLVAPNHFHNSGLREYALAYPEATVVASAAAARRVKAKSGREVRDESRLRQALPLHVSLLVPPAIKSGEIWLSVRGAKQRAWMVGDAFFNIARTGLSPMGLLLRAVGIRPGLNIGGPFRSLLRDRAGYQEWLLGKLQTERPTMLIPCHGEVLSDVALPERLQRLAETLTSSPTVSGSAVPG